MEFSTGYSTEYSTGIQLVFNWQARSQTRSRRVSTTRMAFGSGPTCCASPHTAPNPRKTKEKPLILYDFGGLRVAHSPGSAHGSTGHAPPSCRELPWPACRPAGQARAEALGAGQLPIEGGTEFGCAFCMNIQSRKLPWPACRPAGQARAEALGAGQLTAS